jgi:tripartite-type tricarboxylate transporter receptor subunit TctC
MERIVKVLLATVCLALAAPALGQADYPNKPIRIIVGAAAGGGPDIISRLVAPRLTQQLGSTVIVENRPGAGGVTGSAYVAKSPPDGYTLFMGVMSTNTIQPNLVPNFPFDPLKDLAPVNLIAAVPHVIVVPPSLGVNTLAELIAYARANPGKVSYPSAGTGTASHLGGEMLRLQAGNLDIVHIPYKSAGQSMPDLLSGRVQVGFETVVTTAPHIKSGRLKALLVATEKRLAEFPDVPSAPEAGLPAYLLSTWYGVFAPGGTPAAIINRLHAELANAIQAPEIRSKLTEMSADGTKTPTPADFAALVRSDLARFAKLLKEADIKLTE